MNSQLPSPISSLNSSSPPSPLHYVATTSLNRTSSKRRKFNNDNSNTSTIITNNLSINNNNNNINNINNNNSGIKFTTPPPDSPHPNSILNDIQSRQHLQLQQLQQQQLLSLQFNLSGKHYVQNNSASFIGERENNSTTTSLNALGLQNVVQVEALAGGEVERELQGIRMERSNVNEKKNLEMRSSISGASTGGIPLRRSHDESMTGICTRQIGNRDQFVQALVGASVLAIESIWGTTSPESNLTFTPSINESSAFPLRWFVTEVLRRSRTSCSTLQVALYYLHKVRRQIRDVVNKAAVETKILERNSKLSSSNRESVYPSPPLSPVDIDRVHSTSNSTSTPLLKYSNSPILCGRRMFLASLISAGKFLQDRNFSNKAWSKIAGLPVNEINSNERAFLGLIDFQLFLSSSDFNKWTERLATLAIQTSAINKRTSTTTTSSDSESSGSNLRRTSSEYSVAPPMQELKAFESLPLPLPLPLATNNIMRSNSVKHSSTYLARTHSTPQLTFSATFDSSINLNNNSLELNFNSIPVTTSIATTSTSMEVDDIITTSLAAITSSNNIVSTTRPVRNIPNSSRHSIHCITESNSNSMKHYVESNRLEVVA